MNKYYQITNIFIINITDIKNMYLTKWKFNIGSSTILRESIYRVIWAKLFSTIENK